MRKSGITAVIGGVLLAAGIAVGALASEQEPDPINLGYLNTGTLGVVGDLDEVRARGADPEQAEPREQVRQALGPILLIYLLQRNRFSDGGNILQPIVTR